MTNPIIESILFSLALSLDSFITFFGYGASKINVRIKPLLLTILINILMLLSGIILGKSLSYFLSDNFSKYFSFSLLLIVGIIKFFSEIIKMWLSKVAKKNNKIKISIFNFNLFLDVVVDPLKADVDKDKNLSIKEAIIIGIILSFDSLCVGFGIGIENNFSYLIILFSFIINFSFSVFGNYLGKKITKKTNINISWISGLTLILLAFLKII